jgi:hypothetical protein
MIEQLRSVRDQAGEDVKPPDRAFRVGEARHPAAEAQAFHQGNNVNTAALQDGPIGKANLVHAEVADAIHDCRAGPRKEARPDPVGDIAKPQIEARRLDLIFLDLADRMNIATAKQLADILGGQDAALMLDNPLCPDGRLRGKFALVCHIDTWTEGNRHPSNS